MSVPETIGYLLAFLLFFGMGALLLREAILWFYRINTIVDRLDTLITLAKNRQQ